MATKKENPKMEAAKTAIDQIRQKYGDNSIMRFH